MQAGDTSYSCRLNAIPCIGFYRALHTYLKKQPRITKVLIGRFYIAVDCKLKEKGSRPDNVYRYIDNITRSKRQSDEPMVYNIQGVKEMGSQLKKCSEKLEELNAECTELRQRFEISRSQLKTAKLALRATTDENLSLKKKCEFTKHKFDKRKHTNAFLETECVRLQLENLDLLDESSDAESGDEDFSITNGDECEAAELSLQSIIGHQRYSPEIRKLYHSLLADQVPVSKTANLIRSVLILL